MKELIDALQVAIMQQGKEIQILKENNKILRSNIDKRIKILEQKIENLEPEPRIWTREDINSYNQKFLGI